MAADKKRSKTAHIPIYGSKFYMVINTNQPVGYGNLPIFTSIMANLVLSANIYNFFMWKEKKQDEWIHDPQIAQLYASSDDLSILSNIEIGPIHGKVHANITINFTHYHYFQIDVPKLRAWIRMKSGNLFTPNIRIEDRMLWPTDRKYALKDYGYVPEFSIHNKLYDVHGKSSVFNEEVKK